MAAVFCYFHSSMAGFFLLLDAIWLSDGYPGPSDAPRGIQLCILASFSIEALGILSGKWGISGVLTYKSLSLLAMVMYWFRCKDEYCGTD